MKLKLMFTKIMVIKHRTISDKILLQSIFRARIINKNRNKSKNSKISRTNSEATSGNPNATLKYS